MPWPRTIPRSGTVKTDPKAFPWVMVAETTLPSASAAETWLVSGSPPPAAKGRRSTWSGKAEQILDAAGGVLLAQQPLDGHVHEVGIAQVGEPVPPGELEDLRRAVPEAHVRRRRRLEAGEHVQRLHHGERPVGQDRPEDLRLPVAGPVGLGDARLEGGHVLAGEDAPRPGDALGHGAGQSRRRRSPASPPRPADAGCAPGRRGARGRPPTARGPRAAGARRWPGTAGSPAPARRSRPAGPRRRGIRRPPGPARAARSAATGAAPSAPTGAPMPAICPGTATASGPWTLASPATEQSYSSSLVPLGPAPTGPTSYMLSWAAAGALALASRDHDPAGLAFQDHGGHQVAADPVLVGMAHGAGETGRGRRVEGVAAVAEDPFPGRGDQLRFGRHDAAGADHGVRGPVGHHAQKNRIRRAPGQCPTFATRPRHVSL